jgi:DNA polymerase III epsilon subunit-like protein
MSDVYISVDIETSGPLIGRHSMLQIGACVVDLQTSRFERKIKPISDEVDADAMQVVGRPLSFFNDVGVEPALAMLEFENWLNTAVGDGTPVFVGFNAAFDWGFVNWYLLTYVGRNPFGVAPLDIKSYYAGLSGVQWPETRSSRLPAAFRNAGEHTHDALSDAIQQAEVFRRMRDSR